MNFGETSTACRAQETPALRAGLADGGVVGVFGDLGGLHRAAERARQERLQRRASRSRRWRCPGCTGPAGSRPPDRPAPRPPPSGRRPGASASASASMPTSALLSKPSTRMSSSPTWSRSGCRVPSSAFTEFSHSVRFSRWNTGPVREVAALDRLDARGGHGRGRGLHAGAGARFTRAGPPGPVTGLPSPPVPDACPHRTPGPVTPANAIPPGKGSCGPRQKMHTRGSYGPPSRQWGSDPTPERASRKRYRDDVSWRVAE